MLRCRLWISLEGGKVEIPNEEDKPESPAKGLSRGVRNTTKGYSGLKPNWKNI